jgi:hypothetical protein
VVQADDEPREGLSEPGLTGPEDNVPKDNVLEDPVPEDPVPADPVPADPVPADPVTGGLDEAPPEAGAEEPDNIRFLDLRLPKHPSQG